METTYILTFIVDGRDWSSRPIKGSLQEATDEAKDQLRISRFYGKKPKKSPNKINRIISIKGNNNIYFRLINILLTLLIKFLNLFKYGFYNIKDSSST